MDRITEVKLIQEVRIILAVPTNPVVDLLQDLLPVRPGNESLLQDILRL